MQDALSRLVLEDPEILKYPAQCSGALLSIYPGTAPVERLLQERSVFALFSCQKPVFQTTDEPVFETSHKHKCVRTTDRLSRYGKDVELMGAIHIEGTPFQGCPETTNDDVHYDDIDYLVTWLKSNISIR